MRLLNKIFAITLYTFCVFPLFASELTKFDAKTLQCMGIGKEFCLGSRSKLLWQITLCDLRGKEVCKVTNEDAVKRYYKKSDLKQELIFDNIAINGKPNQLTVKVTITNDKKNNKELWHISWTKRTPFEIKKVKFPILTKVISPGMGDVMFPIGCFGGRLYRNNKSARSNIYPSFTGFTQIASFTYKDKTLVVYPRDNAGLVKLFSLLPDQTYSIETEIPLNCNSLPFDIQLAILKGNYLAAAKDYRAWAIKSAPWLKKGLLSKRTDLPKEFFAAGPWFCLGWTTPESMNNMVKRAEEACGMPISLHWYVWHKENFDSKYPDLSPQNKFSEVVQAMQQRGNYIVPYINAHIWDQSLASHATAKNYAVIQRDGSKAIESWGTPKRNFSVMCPGTKFYQDYMAEYASKLIVKSGLKGLYLDQISAVIPAWCYDKKHKHILGPELYWQNGYDILLSNIKKMSKKQVALFSECAQEIHYSNITGNLCWIPIETEDIPLLPAIYSGYTTYFGSPAAKDDSFQAFAVIQQRAFLWGVQPGWSQVWLINKKQYAQYLGMLGKLRIKLLPYLTFGEYLGEVPLKNLAIQEDTLNYKGPNGTIRSIQTPSIQSSIWTDHKGNQIYIFANATSLTQIVNEKIDCKEGKYTVKIDGVANNIVYGDKLPITLTLDPYEVRYVELVPLEKAINNQKYSLFHLLAEYGIFVEEQIDSIQKINSSKLKIDWKVKNITNKSRNLTVNEKSYNITPNSEIKIQQFVDNSVTVQFENKKITFKHSPKILDDLEICVDNQKVVESNTPIPLIINLKNNTDKPIELEVKLTLQKSWILPKGSTIKIISKAGLSSFKVPAISPNLNNRKQFPGRFRILKSGKNIFSSRLTYQVIPSPPKCIAMYLAAKPKIDGLLDEYKMCPQIKLTPQNNGKKSTAVFSNEQDCSAIVRLGYDKNNLYFAAVVEDNVHHQQGSEASLWKGDCIQVSILGLKNRKGGVTGEEKDFVMALTNYGSELYDFQTKSYFGTCVVTRKDGKTIYEAAIPWKHFNLTLDIEKEMAISFVISDNDGTSSMKGYLELTPGIFGTKDSSAYRALQFK